MTTPVTSAPLATLPASLVPCPGEACALIVQRERALIEALGVAVYTVDATGQLTFYNKAAAQLWGWSPPLGDQRWCGSWRLVAPDGSHLPHDRCPMATCLRENRPIRDTWA